MSPPLPRHADGGDRKQEYLITMTYAIFFGLNSGDQVRRGIHSLSIVFSNRHQRLIPEKRALIGLPPFVFNHPLYSLPISIVIAGPPPL